MSRQPGPPGGMRNLPYRPSGSGGGGGGPCGNINHIARECPHPRTAGADRRGGRGGGQIPNTNTRSAAPLPQISTALADESTNENELVKRFERINRTAESKPCRPSYGIKGDAVEFRTNYFPVRLPDELVLHRYSIKSDVEYDERKQLPEPKGKKLKRIIELMLATFLATLRKSKVEIPIATDFKSTLVCGAMIPQSLWVTKIKYCHENDRGPSNDSRTYTIRIEKTPPVLKISELKDFLASTTTIAPFSDRESMLQALNIIFGHHAKASPMISMVGGNKAFNNAKNKHYERWNLEAGLEALRGYFLSVRLATFRTIINVNVCHGAFYEAIWLPHLIDNWASNKANREQSGEWKWRELETFLKGVKVKTDYLRDKNHNQITQVRSIKSFATTNDGGGTSHPPDVQYYAAPPNDVSFYLDDEKDVKDTAKQGSKGKKNKNRDKDNYISVAKFFKSKYNIDSDKDGNYPVINFASQKDPIYVPAEACTVEPGQLGKLTPSQMDIMKQFSIRKPPANKDSITSKGLPILGLEPKEDSLRRFEVGIDDRMVAVHGRMLTKPRVLYKGDTPAEVATGGWNIRGRQFKTLVPNTNGRLSNWGCLVLHYPKDKSSYELAIKEFQKSLKACGIETDRPLTDRMVLTGQEEDYFHKTRGLNFLGTIRQMQQRHTTTADILLVILPKKDTTLYNGIKKLCDQTIGIHTVCVVGSGFRKQNNSTYLANVTLKFNLKLGGTNHTLGDIEMGIVSKNRTMVVGIDVVHPSPGSGKASVASMVASIDKNLAQWPVDLQVQVREGQEMLDKIDIMLMSRLALWRKDHDVYPENILVYRDGVSESQYQKVLDEELARMRDCSKAWYDDVGEARPRFTLIIVGKRHHTRFYPPEGHPRSDSNGNPERGLVVDRGITEARNWDFFLQSHDAIQGTARPAHYYVLWDEIFTNPDLQSVHDGTELGAADRLERLSHSLCYMFSRAAKAVSIPAPVYYADIACTRAGRYLAERSTDSQSVTSDNSKLTAAQREHLCAELQAKIRVHDGLKDSMFYV